jgi:hypothetical protein
MMRSRERDKSLGFPQATIGSFEMLKKSRDSRRADSDMKPNLNVILSQLTGHNAYPLTGTGVFHPQKVVGQLLTETSMDISKTFRRYSSPCQPPVINPPLHLNMCSGFFLEIALLSVVAIVVI